MKITKRQLRKIIKEVMSQPPPPPERIPVGTRVSHPEWGTGEVVGHGDHEFDHLVRWDKLPNRDRLAHRFQLVVEAARSPGYMPQWLAQTTNEEALGAYDDGMSLAMDGMPMPSDREIHAMGYGGHEEMLAFKEGFEQGEYEAGIRM